MSMKNRVDYRGQMDDESELPRVVKSDKKRGDDRYRPKDRGNPHREAARKKRDARYA